MLERTVNLWSIDADAKVVTTNGAIKYNGENVMGAGTALQARGMWPNLPGLVGDAIRLEGNHVYDFQFDNVLIITFPVKHTWWQIADIELIKRSADELVTFVDTTVFGQVAMPRPGCGNGRLRWEDVKPVIESILDDRFTVVNL